MNLLISVVNIRDMTLRPLSTPVSSMNIKSAFLRIIYHKTSVEKPVAVLINQTTTLPVSPLQKVTGYVRIMWSPAVLDEAVDPFTTCYSCTIEMRKES